MDLEQFKDSFDKIDANTNFNELESTFYSCAQHTSSENVTDFVAYLHKHKWIDTETMAILLTRTSVELSKLNPDKSQQPFSFLGRVGIGGMSEILLARDNHLLRHVAYKKLHTNYANNSEVREQFFSEIQITSQLEHLTRPLT